MMPCRDVTYVVMALMVALLSSIVTFREEFSSVKEVTCS
jgi:hypothetical protein